MRPIPGDDAFGRSRASDSDPPSAFNLPTGPQMTYFLADESTIGSAPQQPPAAIHRSKDNNLNNTRKTSAAADSTESSRPRRLSHHNLDKEGSSSRGGSNKPPPVQVEPVVKQDDETILRPVTPPPFRSSAPSNFSMPVTPSLMGVSGPASAMSSVSSRRNSFSGSLFDDSSNHAPSLDGEAYRELPASMMDSGSAPQLVMPSIKMPSRRPFTDEGKSMGRLKVLIAGDSGLGKTSLIKAIVQSCEHIVHVDPITPSMASSMTRSVTRQRGSNGNSRRQSSRGGETGTSQITEIYASTKPYPEWWSEIDDFSVLKRRKSLGDAVLDRNICFVDTPGYGSGSSSLDTITPVSQYIESHLQRMSSNDLADGDILNLLGGEGGVQIDVVFYMISNRLRPVDTMYLRQLVPLTNIIFLVAQSDLMSADQVAASKDQILSQLNEANIRPFSFAMPGSAFSASSDPSRRGLYAISSAIGSDHDNMDASLLMSPDYVQPLICTELATLVDQVFSQNGAAWLRHSAARKYVQWRKSKNNNSEVSRLKQEVSLGRNSSSSNNTFNSNNNNNNNNSQVLTPPMGPPSSYALARITDYTQREERLAQVRFTNWAADLQRSIARERAQFEALARSERAIWLTEKLSDCVQDGTLVAVSGGGGGGGGDSSRQQERMRDKILQKLMGERNRSRSSSSSGQSSTGQTQVHQDPLGLLQVAANMRYRSLVALEVLGGLGVLSGLALWASNQFWHVGVCDWLVGEWDRFWGGR
ncbi:hypothetical protein B0T17DRAFT_576900 [Bombardia bombarda]|uniref:Septin-type G domain-containing protein n=1 Tax=Bombardia bombarda TaxID=252184 RepID=A0AA40C9N5_9PEZI|nr:hypothetical protein B0T17DRAFT_576900 [Bombardia bombarda]